MKFAHHGSRHTGHPRSRGGSENGSDTAAVEVDDVSALAAREDDAPAEGIAALWVEQTETLQEIARIAPSREMSAQAPAGGITDPPFFDQEFQATLQRVHDPRCEVCSPVIRVRRI
jgi:hypothetical protein